MKDDPDLPLTPDDVADIIAALGSGEHDRLELTTPRFHLVLARGESGQWTQSWSSQQNAPLAPVAAAPTAVAVATEPDDPALVAVRPPLPGTFYRAPKPGAPAFVNVGDRVEADSVVCIIETMKLMTSVHAGTRGEVVAILVDDGTLIDKQTVMLRIRP